MSPLFEVDVKEPATRAHMIRITIAQATVQAVEDRKPAELD